MANSNVAKTNDSLNHEWSDYIEIKREHSDPALIKARDKFDAATKAAQEARAHYDAMLASKAFGGAQVEAHTVPDIITKGGKSRTVKTTVYRPKGKVPDAALVMDTHEVKIVRGFNLSYIHRLVSNDAPAQVTRSGKNAVQF